MLESGVVSNIGKKAVMARRDSGLVEVHVRDLPRPTSTVVANWVAVERVGPEIEITFGQLVRRERRLNAALVVTMPLARVAELVGPGEFMTLLDSFAATHALAEQVPDAGVAMPAERIVFERATVALLAHAEHEAEARFFHVPAESLIGHSGNPRDRVLGIVTVTMPTSLLWYLCRRFQELVS